MKEWPPEPPSSPYPLWTRILAYILDGFILSGLLLLVAVLELGSPWVLLAAMVDVLFRALTTWQFHGTPFKRAFGISVVSLQSGQRLSLSRCLLREAPLLLFYPFGLPGPIQGISMLGYAMFSTADAVLLVVRPDRRTLHDMLAGSVVVSDYALPRPADGAAPMLVN